MKKVLILAYDFPPYVSVGGLRPYSWYKYMSEYGFFPIVVTRQWSNENGNALDFITASKLPYIVKEEKENGVIIKTPYKPNFSNKLLLKYGESKYKLLRKTFSAFYEITQYLYPVGPKSKLYFAAKDYLKENAVDVIIATGEPYILFKYASQFSKEFNIPWIADYRDPWIQNKNVEAFYFKKKWESFFERKYLKNVSVITTVSEFFKNKISESLPAKKYKIIPNGYDSKAIEVAGRINQGTEKMSIAFVGAIYDWHPIESFLNVSNEFVKEIENPKFQINFYGVNQSHFKKDLNEIITSKFPKLSSYVTIYPKMKNEELVQKLVTNNLFLLFNYYAYMGTKIYDYLGLKRNIILCYANDPDAKKLKEQYYNLENNQSPTECVQEKLIKETNSGIIVQDAAHLKDVLNEFYNEFQEKGQITCNASGIKQFSREIQVEKLCEIMTDLITFSEKE